MQVSGRTVVITGAGSGIGRALVQACLSRGASVAAVDLSQEGLDGTAAACGAGDRLSLHRVDITDRAAVEALPAAVIAHHGTVDVVVNNAGIIQPFVPFAELGMDVVDRVLRVNLYGPIHVLKAFLPHLLARPEAHVANVSSMGGFMPFPGQTVYGASKAAVKLLTEGLYAELADTRVGVTLVMPGAIATNITENSGVEPLAQPAGDAPMKALPADEAARILLDGIEAGRLHVLIGQDAKMLAAAARIAPRRSIRFVQRQMKKHLGT